MTRTARKKGQQRVSSATPWAELKSPQGAGEATDGMRDSGLRRVKKKQLKATRGARLIKLLTRKRLKRLNKKTGREICNDHTLLLQPTEEDPGFEYTEDSVKEEDSLPVATESGSAGNSSHPCGTPSRGLLKKPGSVSPWKKVRFADKLPGNLLESKSHDPSSQTLASANPALARIKSHKKKAEPRGTTAVARGGEMAVVNEKTTKSREARKQRRLKNKVCFNCRQSGHRVDQCPRGAQTGICFKCGAGDHTSAKCKARIPEGEFPFAKCFICGETGHLSKSCPDNPKGLYPKGGSCKNCGSVEHLRANCPEKPQLKKRKVGVAVNLTVITNQSADAEELPSTPAFLKRKKAKPKIVKF